MQSFLQYRKLAERIEREIGSDPEKKPGPFIASNLTVRSSIDSTHSAAHQALQSSSPAPPSPQLPLDSRNAPSTFPRGSSYSELGVSFVSGVDVRERTTQEGGDNNNINNEVSLVFVVTWSGGADDVDNPHNWSFCKKAVATLLVAMVCFVCMVASSIDAAVMPQAAEDLGVSSVVESLATAMFLVGSAVGCLFTGPFSETFGRNPVYIGTMLLFMIWVMASALAPNIGAQLAFRFLVGVFGCAPLTCAGGTIADLYDPLEKIYGFPLFAVFGFGGSMLGPVIGSFIYTSDSLSWRFADWITLAMAGLVTVVIFFLLPETHPGVLQLWRAKHLRRATGDERYQAQSEIGEIGFWKRMHRAVLRPWLFATDMIVVLISLYLTIIWAVLFTFLDGYAFIFTETYGISQGLTNVCFVAMYVGVLLSSFMVPVVYKLTMLDIKRQQEQQEQNKSQGDGQPNTVTPTASRPRPETRLYFAMLGGGWAIPVSLFWLAWTTYPSVSIWSPILATTLFGFGLINVFLSSYMFIIDVYQVNAASALTLATFVRYIVSGGLTVAGIPFYQNVGVHWTLTIMACLGGLCAPIPYLLYRYGLWIRSHSKHAVS